MQIVLENPLGTDPLERRAFRELTAELKQRGIAMKSALIAGRNPRVLPDTRSGVYES